MGGEDPVCKLCMNSTECSDMLFLRLASIFMGHRMNIGRESVRNGKRELDMVRETGIEPVI